MSEIWKVVGQLIVSNVSLSVVIFLAILSCIFKITKIEINPISWIFSKLGRVLTKDLRNDVADLKIDYNDRISNLKDDIDSFKEETNQAITEIKTESTKSSGMLKKRMDQLEKSNDMQSVRQIRAHILAFANSCMRGEKHTQKDFDNIFEEDKEYARFVKKHKIVNARYKEDFEFIVQCYHKCLEENGFLTEREPA